MNTSGVPVITSLSLMTFASLAMGCPAAPEGLVPVGAPFPVEPRRMVQDGLVLCPALAFQGHSCNCTDLFQNIDLSRSTRHGRVMRPNFEEKRTIFSMCTCPWAGSKFFGKPCAKQHALLVDPRGVFKNLSYLSNFRSRKKSSQIGPASASKYISKISETFRGFSTRTIKET